MKIEQPAGLTKKSAVFSCSQHPPENEPHKPKNGPQTHENSQAHRGRAPDENKRTARERAALDWNCDNHEGYSGLAMYSVRISPLGVSSTSLCPLNSY